MNGEEREEEKRVRGVRDTKPACTFFFFKPTSSALCHIKLEALSMMKSSESHCSNSVNTKEGDRKESGNAHKQRHRHTDTNRKIDTRTHAHKQTNRQNWETAGHQHIDRQTDREADKCE